MMPKTCLVLAALTFIAQAPLTAQDNRMPFERAFITVNVPFQVLKNDFSESLTVADTVRTTENVTFLMEYPSARGALVDVGAGVRLTSNVGIGLTGSWSQRSNSGSVKLSLPNPLIANSPLELSTSLPELTHRELGLHIQALYARSLGRTLRVMVSGGPSIFSTAQDVVRSIEVDILPGFRTLGFDRALIAQDEKTSVGFNVGADLTWAFARHIGLGTTARYSRATITRTPASESGVGRAISAHAGGLHLGGGIRLLF